MKIGIACGGTGGHVFPGLATAEVLRARGHEVTLWVSGKDIEKEALGGWNGPVITVKTSGFPSRPGLKSFSALRLLWRAFLQCRRVMRISPPDIFLAMGGYASVAPVMAAHLLSIPVVLHEANVIPGRANRLLSRWADVFALGFEETRSHIRHRNMIYTGVPLRKINAENVQVRPLVTFSNGRAGQPCPAAAGLAVRPYLFETPIPQADWTILKSGIFTILVMGGSRGAHQLNEIVAKTVVNLHAKGKAVQIIHLTGTDDENRVRKIYHDCGVPHLVFAFLHDVAQAYRRTSLAICRAGASTCAEIAQYGVPALLVPYPYAASNHQLANARAVAISGAADVIEENELTIEWLTAYICALVTDHDKLLRMKNAALKRADNDAASVLADLVMEHHATT